MIEAGVSELLGNGTKNPFGLPLVCVQETQSHLLATIREPYLDVLFTQQ